MDDLKISHVSQDVIDNILKKLELKYGKEAPLTIHRGKVHDYLGMTIDYTKSGKVMFKMHDYVEALLAECPRDLLKGPSVTPAANHLFEVNPNATKLSSVDSDMYHHLVAKLLYLGKRTRPDILLAVCFLTTRVSQPDEDDWKKLGRCLQYIEETKNIQDRFAPKKQKKNLMNLNQKLILKQLNGQKRIHGSERMR